MEVEQLQQIAVAALDELKGIDICTLNISKLTSIADVMIICSARSSRHLKALADAVVEQVKSNGERVLSAEGTPNSGWILIDLGDVIVHIMLPETRTFYSLEKLWGTTE